MKRRVHLLSVALLASVSLAGCTSSEPAAPISPTPSATVDEARSHAQDTLRRIREAMEAARTYRMSMTVTGGPETVSLVGRGDVSSPSTHKADATITVAGGVSSRLLILGDAAYVQVPGSTSFVAVPPDTLARTGGQDVRALVFPTENLRASERAVTAVTDHGPDRLGPLDVRRYTVTLDPARLLDGPVPTTGAPSTAAPAPPLSPMTPAPPASPVIPAAPVTPADPAAGATPSAPAAPTVQGGAPIPGARVTPPAPSSPGMGAVPPVPPAGPAPSPTTPTSAVTVPTGPVTFDMWVDAQNHLRKLVMNVSGRTLTTMLDAYGQPVRITAPAQASVTPLPSGSGSADPSAPSGAAPAPSPTGPGGTPPPPATS